jgi:N-methylhydantoinase A
VFRVAIDTGGTFTDFVCEDVDTGHMTFWKTLSTPHDQSEAVLSGLGHLLSQLHLDVGDVNEILLATTVATNAIIERKGSPTCLLTTKGFRDVLIIGRQKRYDTYDLYMDKPAPLLRRRSIFEVDERIAADGRVLKPLDMTEVDRVVAEVVERGTESVAVCLLHSYANPSHEQAIRDRIRARAPRVAISLSTEVAPKYREYERTNTTVANAYVKPIVERYIGGLEAVFANQGFGGRLYAMQSNGGLITPEAAKKYPIRIVESGPSAGVIMCGEIGRVEGFDNVMTFDMGGTTTKVGAMTGGEPSISTSFEVDAISLRRYSGLPLTIPVIELIEIGAGGGSIATTSMGLIRLGPASAGADPGPICYGRGGHRVTITDANLVLGYLNPANFAGGSMKLDVKAAETGIREQIAEPLGLSVRDAAWGIHAVANANMERAMRAMSMEKGRDPRKYAMVAFGGAGPAHAARLAHALGVPNVVIPWGAGVGSAIGLLRADPKFDASVTRIMPLVAAHTPRIAEIYRGLEARIKADVAELARLLGVSWTRFAYMRYAGQGYELKVDLPAGDIDERYVEVVAERFHQTYKDVYGFSQKDSAIETVDWYLVATMPKTATAKTGTPRLEHERAPGSPVPASTRKAYFPEFGEFTDCTVVDRYVLRTGDRIVGPAIIEERESTAVILPGDVAAVSAAGHLIIKAGRVS